MYIKVHVYPGMKQEKINKLQDNQYEFILRAPAARNLANLRSRELIADLYGVTVNQVRQVTGHRSPSKIFELVELKTN